MATGSRRKTTSTSRRRPLTSTVEREGFIIPLWDPLWSNQARDPDFGLYIPAFEPDVRHRFRIDPTSIFATIYEQRFGRPSPLWAGEPMEIFSAGFHIHYLGSGASARIARQGNDDTCLVEIPRWDFHWQSNYFFEEPKVLEPGDELFIECRYDNTAGHQPRVDGRPQEPRDTFWGESSLDEMCIGIFLVAPPAGP